MVWVAWVACLRAWEWACKSLFVQSPPLFYREASLPHALIILTNFFPVVNFRTRLNTYIRLKNLDLPKFLVREQAGQFCMLRQELDVWDDGILCQDKNPDVFVRSLLWLSN
ncbi:MAG: hypothetical protein RBG13Loki_4063 [Promethearchaeota archaeon CR_4]|nr:MAG: hypothetical protein RBG13Loki_4063 [Candidatus Lokiarchaeota archaeon CR_4]